MRYIFAIYAILFAFYANAQTTGCPSCSDCGFKLIERPVNARWSVEGDGSVATPLQFTNDLAAPNDNAVYVMGITGARGWTVGGGTVWWRVIQVGHGFSEFDPISWNGATWELASTVGTSEIHEGVVGYVETVDVFWIVIPGELIKVPAHGYTQWEWQFLQNAPGTIATVPDPNIDVVVGLATDDPDWMIAITDRAKYLDMVPRLGDFENGTVVPKTTQRIDRTVANASFILGKVGGGSSIEVHLYDTFIYHLVPDTILLIPGTDNLPEMNYIYLADTSKTGDSVSLFVNTTGWPDTMQHAPIAKVLAPSNTFLKGYGPLMHLNSQNHLSDTLGQGHLSNINEKLRDFHAQWIEGADFSINILPNAAGPDSVFLNVDTGRIFQLHYRHKIEWPNLGIDTVRGAFVANASPTKYIEVNDLSELMDDANGDTLVIAPDSSLAFYSLVFWGSINDTLPDCKIFVNLPTGSYGDSLELASDIYDYAVYDIPPEYRGTGFLITKYDLRYDSTAGGTYSVLDSCDLRGVLPDPGYRPAGCSPIGFILDSMLVRLDSLEAGGGGGGGDCCDTIPQLVDSLYASIQISGDTVTILNQMIIGEEDVSPEGELRIMSDATGSGNYGGTLHLEINPDYDGSIDEWTIRTDQDDLIIGHDNDDNVLEFRQGTYILANDPIEGTDYMACRNGFIVLRSNLTATVAGVSIPSNTTNIEVTSVDPDNEIRLNGTDEGAIVTLFTNDIGAQLQIVGNGFINGLDCGTTSDINELELPDSTITTCYLWDYAGAVEYWTCWSTDRITGRRLPELVPHPIAVTNNLFPDPGLAYYTLAADQVLNATDTIAYDSVLIHPGVTWIDTTSFNGKRIFTLKSPAYYQIDVVSLPVGGVTINYNIQIYEDGTAIRPLTQTIEGAGSTLGFSTNLNGLIDATAGDVEILIQTTNVSGSPSLESESNSIRITRIWNQ